MATKNNSPLPENDAAELQRITEEQSALQKHLDAARKSNRQHNAVMQVIFSILNFNFQLCQLYFIGLCHGGVFLQEYRNKQNKNQPMVPGQQPAQMGMMGPQQSPLRPPPSSPIHTPQSPMLSPSPSLQQQQQHSPMLQQQQQQNSPLVQQQLSPMVQQQQLSPMVQQQPSPSPQAMQSPSPMIGAQSPGPNSMNAMVQHSPGNPAGMSPHSLQPSPRIGTPHSQVGIMYLRTYKIKKKKLGHWLTLLYVIIPG